MTALAARERRIRNFGVMDARNDRKWIAAALTSANHKHKRTIRSAARIMPEKSCSIANLQLHRMNFVVVWLLVA